jgi:CubicO group peptidase (beta-lactamase class C family)
MRRSSSCATMRHRMIFSLVLLFIQLSICYSDDRHCPSEASINDLLSDAHIPGAVVLVINRTTTIYEYNYGYDCLSTLRPTDANRSIFALASVSKTFIAVSVMQLVQLNRVDLDRDINEYLNSPSERIFHPLYPASKITLRQLLSHSASINRNDQMEGVFVQLGDQALTSTGLAETCYQYLHPNASNWLSYPPGSVTLYSNIGSSLAAWVVERVTRMPYDQYVRENILKPLNIDIDRAAYRLSDLKNQEDLVRHYTFNQSRFDFLNQIFPQLELKQVRETMQ